MKHPHFVERKQRQTANRSQHALGVWEGHHGVSARMSCSREKISRFAASRQVLVACSERELGAMRRKWAARLELLQNFDQRRHIVGQFAFEAKLGAGDWVFEAEHSRMQRLARKRGDGRSEERRGGKERRCRW